MLSCPLWRHCNGGLVTSGHVITNRLCRRRSTTSNGTIKTMSRLNLIATYSTVVRVDAHTATWRVLAKPGRCKHDGGICCLQMHRYVVIHHWYNVIYLLFSVFRYCVWQRRVYDMLMTGSLQIGSVNAGSLLFGDRFEEKHITPMLCYFP